MTRPVQDYARDPIGFIDTMISLNEKGRAWRLSPHQRRLLALAFRWDAVGRLLLRLLLWGEVKKSGKSFLAACLVIWWAFVTPDSEIIVTANDLDQIVGRVFRTMVALCRRNPTTLGGSVTIRATEILVSNGTLIKAIAADYRGAAGARHSLYVVDEPWGIIHENAVRLVEELTPPPTEPNAWGLMTTTAGWTGESALLEGLYQRGLAGERLDPELEVYQADELVMFWSHTPRQPWQTPEYYAEQRRHLRPATFARLHRNEWVTAEGRFITAEQWDACIAAEWSEMEPTHEPEAHAGVDLSVKHDASAVVTVVRDGDLVVLARHRVWQPTASEPMDLDATVGREIRALATRYRLGGVLIDPYQAHSLITDLRAEGLPVTEYAQTSGNLTTMAETLYDLITARRLVVYDAPDLREMVLNAAIVESPRGLRLGKAQANRRIDGAVALAMACVSALSRPALAPLAFV